MDKDQRIGRFESMLREYHPDVADRYLRNYDLMAYLNSGGFFTAPASTKYHGAYEGGLFDHCVAVTNALEDFSLCMGLNWQREESPFIVGMFHDLCKCDQYRLKEKPEIIRDGLGAEVILGEEQPEYEYNDKTVLKGHGTKSILILSQYITLTEEEMLCIRYHMGAYETDDWDGFDRAIRKYPNVLWTHTADMYASKVRGV